MFFVVTTGRSGSMSLAKILSQHPLCICRHEQHRILIKLAAEWRHGVLDTDELSCYLAYKGERMFPHRIGLQLYGESDQKLSFIIPFLAEFGHNAKFIWLIRDGRDVVASMVSRGEYSREEARTVPHLWAKYRIEGDRTGDVSTETWERMDAFEKCCWYWTYTNNLIAADLRALNTEQWIMVRLEELEASLDQLVEFLGLPYYPLRILRANKNYARSYKPIQWSRHEKAAFERWCGDAMDTWYPGWRDGGTSIKYSPSASYRARDLLRTLLAHAAWGGRKVAVRVQRLLRTMPKAVDPSRIR